MSAETNMIVTARLLADPFAFARFTWADSCDECSVVTGGDISDEQLEALIAAKGHEGAAVEGWDVDYDFGFGC